MHRNKEKTAENDHLSRESSRKKKVLAVARSGSSDGSWECTSTAEESEEVTPLPNMKKIFTSLQERRLLTPQGGASAINGPASQPKDGMVSKKHHTT
jgi:hypothetical protein